MGFRACQSGPGAFAPQTSARPLSSGETPPPTKVTHSSSRRWGRAWGSLGGETVLMGKWVRLRRLPEPMG